MWSGVCRRKCKLSLVQLDFYPLLSDVSWKFIVSDGEQETGRNARTSPLHASFSEVLVDALIMFFSFISRPFNIAGPVQCPLNHCSQAAGEMIIQVEFFFCAHWFHRKLFCETTKSMAEDRSPISWWLNLSSFVLIEQFAIKFNWIFVFFIIDSLCIRHGFWLPHHWLVWSRDTSTVLKARMWPQWMSDRAAKYIFSALTMGTPRNTQLDLWCIRNVVTIFTKSFAFLCGRQRERVCVTRKVSRQVGFSASMACGAHIDCLRKMFALCGSSAFCFSTQVPIVYASLAPRCTDSTRSGAFSNFFFSLVFHRAILWDPKSEKHKIHQ